MSTYLYLFLSLYALWILSVTGLQLVTRLLVTGGCEKRQTLQQGQDCTQAGKAFSLGAKFKREPKDSVTKSISKSQIGILRPAG